MLALNHRGNQDSIADMGGITPLVALTHHGQGHSPDVQAYAVLALTEIARHNQENQTGSGQSIASGHISSGDVTSKVRHGYLKKKHF